MAFSIYFYCATAAFGWLFLLFFDVCRIKYGSTCFDNIAEQLTVRMCSLLFLYMAAIPFILTRTNQDNDSFLKRLAFHLQYGLMAILGCSITRQPSSSTDDENESWYHIGDKIYAFLAFFLLFAYTSKNSVTPMGEGPGPTGMTMKPYEGHGCNPRTFLVFFGVAGLLPLVKKFPLDTIVPEGTEITERAKFFYALAQCSGLAVLMILFVPIHFGSEQDHRNTTITIIIVELFFGILMLFHGSAWSAW